MTTKQPKQTSSKDMVPLPGSFLPVFYRNQFRITIDLPTKAQYPQARGKCAVITGSNTGLGLAAARQLLSLGVSHLVMGVRTLDKGQLAADELRHMNSNAKIDVWQLDMDSYKSIHTFVQRCDKELETIDVVILNAGKTALNFATTPGTGHENVMQVNHLSTALLAILFVPLLKKKSTGSVPPRLTIVNSVTAHLCKFPNKDQRPLLPSFDDTAITPFSGQERYGVSKLVSQIFLVRLAEKVDSDHVIINMVDPGLTKGTGLGREATGWLWVAVKLFNTIAGRPVDRGAATYIDAAFGQGKESHGCFLMNCKIAPLACWYYTGGKSLSDTIWQETLQQLDIRDINQTLNPTG